MPANPTPRIESFVATCTSEGLRSSHAIACWNSSQPCASSECKLVIESLVAAHYRQPSASFIATPRREGSTDHGTATSSSQCLGLAMRAPVSERARWGKPQKWHLPGSQPALRPPPLAKRGLLLSEPPSTQGRLRCTGARWVWISASEQPRTCPLGDEHHIHRELK